MNKNERAEAHQKLSETINELGDMNPRDSGPVHKKTVKALAQVCQLLEPETDKAPAPITNQ